MQSCHLEFIFAPKLGVRSLVNKLFNGNNEAYLFQAKILKPTPHPPQKKNNFYPFLPHQIQLNMESWHAKYQYVWIVVDFKPTYNQVSQLPPEWQSWVVSVSCNCIYDNYKLTYFIKPTSEKDNFRY